MKLYCLMTQIHGGLAIKLSPLYAKNTAFKRFGSDRNNICLRKQLNFPEDRLIDSTEVSKQKYYCRMIKKLINTE